MFVCPKESAYWAVLQAELYSSPKIHMLSPNPQDFSMWLCAQRQDLWKVIKVKWGH